MKKCAHTIQPPYKPVEKFFPDGRLTFLGPGDEEKWYGTLSHKPDGKWHVTAEEMMRIFAESGSSEAL